MIGLCRETGCRVHIVHLSSADALPMIAQARDEGLPLLRRDLPALSCLRRRRDSRRRPAVQVRTADPRAREPRTALGGLARRTDRHDRHGSLARSARPQAARRAATWSRAWGGIASLQLALPAVWTEARPARVPIQSVAALDGPPPGRAARTLGLQGSDRRRAAMPTSSSSTPMRASPCRRPLFTIDIALTPYEGRRLTGRVETTYLRGARLSVGVVCHAGRGRPLVREAGQPGEAPHESRGDQCLGACRGRSGVSPLLRIDALVSRDALGASV